MVLHYLKQYWVLGLHYISEKLTSPEFSSCSKGVREGEKLMVNHEYDWLLTTLQIKHMLSTMFSNKAVI